jgi:hypothetical protein
MRNGILNTVLATGLLLAAGHTMLAQDAAPAAAKPAPAAAMEQKPAPDTTVCTEPTVDVYGKDDDRKLIADSMIYYPLVWNRKEGTLEVKNRSEFLKHYDEIFTAELKGKILSQSVKCLPGNDEGASIGDGEMRFFKFATNNKFQITSITQPGIKKSDKLPWE